MILNDSQLSSGLLLIIQGSLGEMKEHYCCLSMHIAGVLMLSEQRTRIYSPRTIDSGIGSLQSLQGAHQTLDESVEIEDDELDSPTDSLSSSHSFSSTLPGSNERQRCGGLSGVYDPVPPSSMTRKYAEPLRPISGPVVTARRKFRYLVVNSLLSVSKWSVSHSFICSLTCSFTLLLTQSVSQSFCQLVSVISHREGMHTRNYVFVLKRCYLICNYDYNTSRKIV